MQASRSKDTPTTKLGPWIEKRKKRALRRKRTKAAFPTNQNKARTFALPPGRERRPRTTFFNSQKLTPMTAPPKTTLGTCKRPVPHPTIAPTPTRRTLSLSILSMLLSISVRPLKSNHQGIDRSAHGPNGQKKREQWGNAQIAVEVIASDRSCGNRPAHSQSQGPISTIRNQGTFFGHQDLIPCSTSFAALRVSSTSASVWARERKAASN